MSEQEMQMKLASQQEKVEALRQEVAEKNKEREFWQQVRVRASIAEMQGQLANDESVKQMIETLDSVALPDKTKAYMNLVARLSVMLADAFGGRTEERRITMNEIEIRITFEDDLCGCEIIRSGETQQWEKLNDKEQVKVCNTLAQFYMLFYKAIKNNERD